MYGLMVSMLMKRILRAGPGLPRVGVVRFIVFVTAAASWACKNDAIAPAATVTVSPATATLQPGDSVQFVVVARYPDGSALTTEFTWTTSNAAVATITATGAVVAVSPGTVTIFARTGPDSGGAVITVAFATPVLTAIAPAYLPAGGGGGLVAVSGSAFTPSSVGEWNGSPRPTIYLGPTLVQVQLSASDAASGRGGFVSIRAASGNALASGSQLFAFASAADLIAPGFKSTCAIGVTGQLFCWGTNQYGQLGIGADPSIKSSPVPVARTLRFSKVSGKVADTCALAAGGDAWCWGGGLNQGQPYGPLPTLVPGGLRFIDISVGAFVMCGITADRLLYCWGNNTTGMFGTGTVLELPTNLPVLSGAGMHFQSVSVGENNVCGVTVDGVAYCWGASGSGEVGAGGGQFRSPVVVAGGLTFTSLEAGGNNVAGVSCGVTPAGGGYCWGAVCQPTRACLASLPALVDGGHIWRSIRVAAGDVDLANTHICGVTTTGEGWCWGGGQFGQLGDGQVYQNGQPTPHAVLGGYMFAAVLAGNNHSCGVTSQHAILCWGSNNSGELGDGTTIQRMSPVAVAGGVSVHASSAPLRH